jgi:gas vesicle protein
MSRSKDIILAGLVGAAAGAVTGVLLAPDKGKKTRKKLSKSIDNVKSDLQDFVDDAKEQVSNLKKSA